MKKKHLVKLIITLMVMLLAIQVSPTTAAPAQQGANLLQNPGFEQPYDRNEIAHGWGPWHNETGAESKDAECISGYNYKPHWSAEVVSSQFIHDGASSQHVGMQYDTWKAGMLQTVSVTPGSRYRFTVYGLGRGSNEPVPAPSDRVLNMQMQIGIDPNGSGVWYDSDIVWSGQASPHDQWQQFTVEATATGDKMTVVTSSNWGVPGVSQCRRFLDVWYDSAALVEVGPPPTATSPPPPPPPPATATPLPPTVTPTPAFTPTNTPVPTDTPTATPEPPKGGIICVNAFADDNANGIHDASEGHMAGVTFTVANGQAIVGQAIAPGTESPVCFEELEPGSYQVAQIVPSRLEMTTAANAVLEVIEGKTYGVEFGSRIRPADSSAPPTAASAVADNNTAATEDNGAAEEGQTAPAEQASGGLSSYSGLIVMVIAVFLLGILIFVALRKQSR